MFQVLTEEYKQQKPKRSAAWRLALSAGSLIVVGVFLSWLRFGTLSAGADIPDEQKVNPVLDFLVWVPSSLGVAIFCSWLVWSTVFAHVDLDDGWHAYLLSGIVFASVMLAVAMIVG